MSFSGSKKQIQASIFINLVVVYYDFCSDVVIPAVDQNVARFLLKNKSARYKLVGAVKDFAFVSIKINSDQQSMSYTFSQLKVSNFTFLEEDLP